MKKYRAVLEEPALESARLSLPSLKVVEEVPFFIHQISSRFLHDNYPVLSLLSRCYDAEPYGPSIASPSACPNTCRQNAFTALVPFIGKKMGLVEFCRDQTDLRLTAALQLNVLRCYISHLNSSFFGGVAHDLIFLYDFRPRPGRVTDLEIILKRFREARPNTRFWYFDPLTGNIDESKDPVWEE